MHCFVIKGNYMCHFVLPVSELTLKTLKAFCLVHICQAFCRELVRCGSGTGFPRMCRSIAWLFRCFASLCVVIALFLWRVCVLVC